MLIFDKECNILFNRKSLMELNNASMEISLETNRNQMLITE